MDIGVGTKKGLYNRYFKVNIESTILYMTSLEFFDYAWALLYNFYDDRWYGWR